VDCTTAITKCERTFNIGQLHVEHIIMNNITHKKQIKE